MHNTQLKLMCVMKFYCLCFLLHCYCYFFLFCFFPRDFRILFPKSGIYTANFVSNSSIQLFSYLFTAFSPAYLQLVRLQSVQFSSIQVLIYCININYNSYNSVQLQSVQFSSVQFRYYLLHQH